MPNFLYDKGEIVQCPECEADLLRFVRPVEAGEPFRVEMFEQLPVEGVASPWLANGMHPHCPICTAPLASTSLWNELLIHIKVRGCV